jgi:predicted nucleotidyltransferase
MNNFIPKLKTNFPFMWAKFEVFLEDGFPSQDVINKLEILSPKIQLALLSSFLLSKKMSYHTNNVLKSDWKYFLKKLNNNKMVYIDYRRGYVDQQEEAIKVIINIFNTLNSILAEPAEKEMDLTETVSNS